MHELIDSRGHDKHQRTFPPCVLDLPYLPLISKVSTSYQDGSKSRRNISYGAIEKTSKILPDTWGSKSQYFIMQNGHLPATLPNDKISGTPGLFVHLC